MLEIGYALSSEEHSPNELVRNAGRAEEAGFAFGLISDHFHPWTDRQGQSPFVWSVIGGIAHATERLRLGTGVTCPILRIHPAIVAQAAASSAAMMPGRFFLGVGSGENLNEHVVGEGWPEASVRQEMLEEAIHIMRELWEGGLQSLRDGYFVVENARIYTLPDEPPPIMVAAAGQRAAEMAGRIGDGLIGTSLDQSVLKAFKEAGGDGKPRYGKVTVCWAQDERTARKPRSSGGRTSPSRGSWVRSSRFRVISNRLSRWSLRTTSRRPSCAVLIRSGTWRRFGPTRPPASTMSTCTK